MIASILKTRLSSKCNAFVELIMSHFSSTLNEASILTLKCFQFLAEFVEISPQKLGKCTIDRVKYIKML